jgi:hypothetical protein
MAIPALAVDVVPYTSMVDLSVNWTRQWSAADTTAGAKIVDTLYSRWQYIPACETFPFAAYVDGKHAYEIGAIDTNMVGDSVFVRIQTILTSTEYFGGHEGVGKKTDTTMMTTTVLGTILPGSADLDTLVTYIPTVARDSVLMWARYVRAMFIVIDSTEANAPGRFGKIYGRKLTLYINAKP